MDEHMERVVEFFQNAVGVPPNDHAIPFFTDLTDDLFLCLEELFAERLIIEIKQALGDAEIVGHPLIVAQKMLQIDIRLRCSFHDDFFIKIAVI